MKQVKPTMLLVEDDMANAMLYKTYISKEPIKYIHVDTGTAALTYLQKITPDVVVVDLGLPDMDGMDILKYIQQQQLKCPVIVITGKKSIGLAEKAVRCGALDFLEKPIKSSRFIVTLINALHQQKLHRLVDYYRNINNCIQYHDFIGASEAMQTVYRTIDNVARSKASVFITGESGTGKELCADAIFRESLRKDKPFVALNCAAIPKQLMESEIFGHVKGAFTGANANRDGAATLADGGTLFLDEIGDMDLELQSKLLRFVQSGTFQKVGSNKTKEVDIRFICATNIDPIAAIKAKGFRKDLYYRLNVIPIKLPALHQRGEDVLLIAKHFLLQYADEENKEFKIFAPQVEAIFMHYNWPGNIRELLNVVHNVVLLNDGQVVTANMLPYPINELSINYAKTETKEDSTTIKNNNHEIVPLWEIEKDHIEQAIELCNGDIPQAAAALGIDASTIYRKRRNWKKNEC